MLELRLFIKTLLLPPAFQLLLLATAALLWRRNKSLAKACAALGILSIWALSTPYIASHLARSIEPEPLLPEQLADIDADAIVILSAYLRWNSAEFGDFVTGRRGIERLRYGVFLQHKLRLPIALTGGRLSPNWPHSLAEIMDRELQKIFSTPATFVETQSRSTAENATYTHAMLAPTGKTRIVLVTHAMHMRRARLLFEKAGFEVVPAPTAFVPGWHLTMMSLVPTSRALDTSSEALHEIMGYIYYRVLDLFTPGSHDPTVRESVTVYESQRFTAPPVDGTILPS